MVGDMDISRRDFDFIFNNVILPPKLPQNQDDNEWESEESLRWLVRCVLQSFLENCSLEVREKWKVVVSMIDNWNEVDKKGGICKESLRHILANLETLGAVAFNVHAQNCGWMAHFDKDRAKIIVDAYEASPRSADVLAASKLTRRFPGLSIEIPAEKIADMTFCEYLAANLSSLSMEQLAEMLPTSRKAGSQMGEERDTAHPGLVTECLMVQLLALGTHNNCPSFEKNTRDDVNWKNARLPWRRSPSWLVLRVAMQTLLQRRFSPHAGQKQYKNFMVYLMVEIGRVALNMQPTLEADQFAIIRAKIGRRAYKLKDYAFSFVSGSVQSSANDIQEHLEMVRREIKVANHIEVSHLPTSVRDDELHMSLDNSQAYLQNAILKAPSQSNPARFNPCHGPRNQLNHCGHPILEKRDVLSLADFEQWVCENLDAWIANSNPSEDVCAMLAGLLGAYAEFAIETYSISSRERSHMFLVILELWVALDKFCVALYPLLGDFSPELPVNFLEPFLLPEWEQMKRAGTVERYLHLRHEKAKPACPNILSDPSPRSFAVRFFDQSPYHQSIQSHIERSARSERNEKELEWTERSALYKELLDRARSLNHKNNHRKRYAWYCEKCTMLREADTMRIDVHEWPLPSGKTELKTVIFELDCPSGFLHWRDATWKLLHDFGRSRNQRGLRNEQNLLNYKELQTSTINRGQRLTLASVTKPFMRSHYRDKDFPVDFKELCVENGLRIKLWDKMRDFWVADQLAIPNLKLHCVEDLPPGPYRVLEYAAHSYRHDQNAVIAKQRDCDSQMNLFEFIAYGLLRAGERVQWYNIARELASPNLSLNEESVSILLHQAAWELGSYNSNTDRREAHRVFASALYCDRLLSVLEQRLGTVETNWKEHNTLTILVSLGLRVLALSDDHSIIERAACFLRRSRNVAIQWCDVLINRLHSQTGHDIKRHQELILKVGTVCQLTYDVEQRHISTTILRDSEDVFYLIRSSIVVHENSPQDQDALSISTKSALLRGAKVLHRLESRLRSLIKRDQSGLDSAIGGSVDGLQVSGLWRFCSGHNMRWAKNKTSANSHGRCQEIYYDILSGKLLVDGRIPGRLPTDYTGHHLYQRIFGSRILTVVPSSLPGTLFTSTKKMGGFEVHFGMEGGQLIIKAKNSKQLLQLVPHCYFLNDFPRSFAVDYVHWLDLKTGNVEFRPFHQAWKSSGDNWVLAFNAGSPEKSCMRRQRVTLIDVRSKLFDQIAGLLETMDSREHIYAARSEAGTIETELVRLRLKFFVNRHGFLESRELGAAVDANQDIGCLYGLKNKLTVQNRGQRSVLIPYGNVTIQRHLDHVHVSISLSDAARARYFQYSLDNHLRTLRGAPDILGSLYQSYMHAVTVFVLPDPFTRRSGTEEAVAILSQASLRSSLPLQSDCKFMLNRISELTPERQYYPKHLKNMQTIVWSNTLSQMAQHDDFQLLSREIWDHSARFYRLHNTAEVGSPVLHRCRGDSHLLERARLRHSNLRSSDFGGAVISLPVSSYYEARDDNILSERSSRVYKIASLVREWTPPVQNVANIVQILKGWDYLCIHPESPSLEELRYSDLLCLSLSDTWGSLYEFCRLSDRDIDSYSVMSLFCAVAFGNEKQLRLIHILLAVAFSGLCRDLPVPGCLNPGLEPKLDLAAGQTLVVGQVRNAILSKYAPFDGPTPQYNEMQEEKQRRLKLKMEYEERKEAEVDFCCSWIEQQWPCESPVFPEKTDIPNVRQTASSDCRSLYTKWYRNLVFFEHVEKVQIQLDSIRVGSPNVTGQPSPRVHNPVRLHHSPRPPTLAEIVCSSSPDRRIELPTSVTFARSQIPQSCCSTNTELRSLLEEIQHHADSGRHEYGNELSASLDAFERISLPFTPKEIPVSRAVLLEHRERSQDCCNEIWLEILSALIPDTNCILHAVCSAGIWPSITVTSMLSFLSVRKFSSIPVGWQHNLISLGKAISCLRRCERLIALFDRRDTVGFFKEAENIGYEDWDAMDNPDWLLLEIENNITIRRQQAEVALKMIEPDLRENAVLQLNMGEGKTSVITPMVASSLANGTRLLRIIVLKPLLRQSTDLLLQCLGGLINRRVYHIPFSRNTPIDNDMLNLFHESYRECKEQRGILIALPEQILSFRLMGLDFAGRDQVFAGDLIHMEQWLQEHCRDVVDESDEVLNTKFQLVYAMGNQQTLDGHNDRWEIIQALLSLVGDQAKRLHTADPTCLGVDEYSNRYPKLRFLKAGVVDAFIDGLFETIGRVGLPGLSFPQWRPRVCESAMRLTRFIDTTESDETIVREAFEGGIVLRRLLVLRGLLAHGVLRFCLCQKRWMVEYGLHPCRSMMAVPYRAKGVPSENAEFGHPDVALILTCLSYYYEGLTKEQVRRCFELLLRENDPPAEYQHWIAKCREWLSQGLHSLSGVNLDDSQSFSTILYPQLRNQKAIIDFYLSRVVFPNEAKEFPRKLSSSAWDIPSQSNSQITTGFSGTNDNRFLLPLSITQRDLPHLLHTNAMVLGNLLREENRRCILAEDHRGQQLRTHELLELIVAQKEAPVRVIIDVGAQILEMANVRVVELWLDVASETDAEAAIFFDENDEAMVFDRQGHTDRLLASPFRQRLDVCLVFLDQHHSRGVDLKLPLSARAAVTLGPRLTKDRLVQACSRMRELGNGQSMVFIVPPEVRHGMTLQADQVIASPDVIRWTLSQTCEGLDTLRLLWAHQGMQYHRRSHLWKSLTSGDGRPDDIAYRIQEPEAQTLLQLYAPWERQKPTFCTPEVFNSNDSSIKKLLMIWQSRNACGTGDSRLHEEQEREIAHEVEKEQKVSRPLLVGDVPHHLHSNVRHFATHGNFPTGAKGESYDFAFKSLSRTTVGHFSFPYLGMQLLVTDDFTRTVKDGEHDANDEFLKPVHWILSGNHSSNLLIISQYEANELLPQIEKSEHARLHVYSPRTTKGMQSFRDLQFLITGAEGFSPMSFVQPTMDLELFAGSLYFETFQEYTDFRRFLGLVTDNGGDMDKVNVTNEGFVDRKGREIMGWPVESPFEESPLQFLDALINVRRRGYGYLQTHVGAVVAARMLTEDDF